MQITSCWHRAILSCFSLHNKWRSPAPSHPTQIYFWSDEFLLVCISCSLPRPDSSDIGLPKPLSPQSTAQGDGIRVTLQILTVDRVSQTALDPHLSILLLLLLMSRMEPSTRSRGQHPCRHWQPASIRTIWRNPFQPPFKRRGLFYSPANLY